MNPTKTRLLISAAGLVAALLAGCSATGSPTAPMAQPAISGASDGPQTLRALARTTQQSGLVFVAEADNNAVVMYPEGGSGTSPVGSLTNDLTTPVAVAVDAGGNLFVANLSSDAVVKFAPPYTGSPIATYSTGFNAPFSLTAGPDGTLFVAAGSSVLEFPPNGTKPSLTLKVPSPVGLIADAHGNLFVSDATLNDVEEFAAGSSSGTRLHLTGIRAIGGIARDRSGNLLVADQGITDPAHGGAVDVFAPGSSKPSHVFSFSQDTTAGVVLGSAGDHMFVANSVTQGYNKLSVFDDTYPGGMQAKVIPVLVRGAAGIAVAPRAPF